MAEFTNIAWADHTYNPWIGCTEVSDGCKNCYAEAEWDTRRHRVEWGGERSRTKTADQPRKWDRKARLKWDRVLDNQVRPRVFCASLADIFDNQVPEEWRTDLWALIDECRALDWMLLTKRPQNIQKMLPVTGFGAWPWPHVWLGTTAENQEEGDRRLPILLSVPAVVHFASVEPQLGPVDLRKYLGHASEFDMALDWVICGGESGNGCHPFDPDWARALRDQCDAAGTAFFMKQLGGHPNKHDKLDDLPPDLRVRRFPPAPSTR